MPDTEEDASVEAEAEEEVPEAADIRDSLIVSGDSTLFDYPLGVLSVGEGAGRKLVAAAAIAESANGEVVVAFPARCWDRAASKRVLSLDLVRKVSTHRAKCARLDDRSRALDSEIRICIGLLTAEGEAAFDLLRDFETDVELSYPFGTSVQPELLPYARSLADLAGNTFEFLTAESAAPEDLRGGPGQSGSSVEDRLVRLEGCFQAIQADLKQLVSKKAPAAAAPSEAPSSAKAPSRATPKRGPRPELEGMDQSVVQAALDSGIDMKHIEEMGRFLRSQGKPTKDEPRATAKARFAKQAVLADDDLDDEDPEEEIDLPIQEAGDPIQVAVTKLTAIAAQLADGKKKDSSLEALLDGSGQADASGSGTSGRKSAAALRALKERLRSQRGELTKVIERNMSADFALRSALPGSSQVPVSCRAWLESRSRVQHYPSTIRFLWMIAGIGDALREEKYEEAYLRSLLGLAAGDQLSIDKGNWNVASEILLEDPPPFPAFTSHTLPTGAEVPFTKLIDARWMEIFIARLREVDLYLESRRKLAAGPGGGHRKGEDGGAPQGRGENEEKPGGPWRPQKGNGRGRGSKGAPAAEDK